MFGSIEGLIDSGQGSIGNAFDTVEDLIDLGFGSLKGLL